MRRKPQGFAVGLSAAGLVLLLGACGGAPSRPDRAEAPRKGGYYLDDGPHANPPANLDQVADAEPRAEPIKASTSRPYTALGRTYTPMTALAPYTATGVASWYGKRYHGQPTASGEIYDMYAMTAAHPTLPIPSYVRVTRLATGKAVVVRVNDRGPFRGDRLIDLSYTAAYKLEILADGSATVRVESILANVAKPVAPIAEAGSPQPATAVVSATAPAKQAQGVYLQLGAFSLRENAQAFLRRLSAEFAWLAEVGSVYPGGGLYRVQAGPYATRDEALQAASRIDRAIDLEPLIVAR